MTDRSATQTSQPIDREAYERQLAERLAQLLVVAYRRRHHNTEGPTERAESPPAPKTAA